VGGRRGELLGLTWQRINLAKKEVLVSCETSKGRKDRLLPLVGDLGEELAAWKQSQDAAPEDPVFPLSVGLRQIYDDWWMLCKSAGVGVVKFKHFRSTCASELLMSGASTVTAKEFLGHSTTLVLERHYANVLPGLRKAAEARAQGQ
jgi:integrase